MKRGTYFFTRFISESSTETSNIISSDILELLQQRSLLLKVDGVMYGIKYPTAEELKSEMEMRIKKLEAEIEPLSETGSLINRKGLSSSRRVLWGGFAYVVAQTVIMARLTWWEYSWDVTEPVAYFLTTSLGILGFLFYIVTSRNFSPENWGEVTKQNKIRKLVKKSNFPYDRYNNLCKELESLKKDLSIISSHIESSQDGVPNELAK